MNETQLVITIGYAIVLLASLAGLWVLVRSVRRRRPGDPEPEHSILARLENRWGVMVVAMLIALLAITIFQVPYDDTTLAEGADGQRVTVSAQQFAFVVQPSSVRAGAPVEFELTSRDVQHGFGVYKGTKLIGQVQVPAAGEPAQKLVLEFDEPGSYDILCLEFCGFQHHLMRGKLEVR